MGQFVLTVLLGGAGLALLYFGGEWLVRGAAGLAARTGMSALAIGLTVVAFGTSAPELVVSLDAVLSGANDIAVGNVVGSNIANIALILGLAVLVTPALVEAKVVRLDAPLMVAASVLVLAVLADGSAGRLEAGLLLAGLVVYTVSTFRTARQETGAVRAELASAAPEVAQVLGPNLLRLVAGLGLLVAGGHLLVTAAVTLATLLGVGQAAIGLTIVAVGTSLPELATSLVAAARGQGDIAVGNVVGSNLFNILGILGVTALVQPLALGAITWLDLGLMTALAAVLVVRLRVRPILGRGDGTVLLAVFVGYTAWRLVA